MDGVAMFTISRREWLRGDPDSYLLRPSDKKKCCLGIYLEACGLPSSRLSDVTSPEAVDVTVPGWMVEFDDEFAEDPLDLKENTRVVDALMATNDRRGVPEDDRENQIRRLFSEAGITVEFVD